MDYILIATGGALGLLVLVFLDWNRERRERRPAPPKGWRFGTNNTSTYPYKTSTMDHNFKLLWSPQAEKVDRLVDEWLAATKEQLHPSKLEQRRRVRVFAQHDVIEPDPERDEDTYLADYHEMVPRGGQTSIWRDALCRENSGMDYEWDLWVCNNSLCGAYAYVRRDQLENTAQGWIDELAPAPAPYVDRSAEFTSLSRIFEYMAD